MMASARKGSSENSLGLIQENQLCISVIDGRIVQSHHHFVHVLTPRPNIARSNRLETRYETGITHHATIKDRDEGANYDINSAGSPPIEKKSKPFSRTNSLNVGCVATLTRCPYCFKVFPKAMNG